MWETTLTLLMLAALLSAVVLYLWHTPARRPRPLPVRVSNKHHPRYKQREE